MTSNALTTPVHEMTLAEMSDEQIRSIVGELIKANNDLKELNTKLSDAQNKLIQSEKLASIGQLAAGVAHEINNPIGFIFSNFGTLEQYLQDLFQMLDAYELAEASVGDPTALERIRSLKADLDIDYLKDDIPNLMRESRDGIQRVRKIVQDLKDFSRVDARQEWESVDLHTGIDSTLNIVNNEIKYKADVVKQYGPLPEVQCLPSELNQVFMNLLVNAAHAITAERGTITISTGIEGANVWVDVQDTGAGIAAENMQRIFDPFFTTKPVGKGTGLGLSLSYGIVQKHGGRMEVSSELGVGTRFRVTIPIKHEPAPSPADAAN
jgi:signal transduction histidine kinase